MASNDQRCVERLSSGHTYTVETVALEVWTHDNIVTSQESVNMPRFSTRYVNVRIDVLGPQIQKKDGEAAVT